MRMKPVGIQKVYKDKGNKLVQSQQMQSTEDNSYGGSTWIM